MNAIIKILFGVMGVAYAITAFITWDWLWVVNVPVEHRAFYCGVVFIIWWFLCHCMIEAELKKENDRNKK